MKAAHLDTAALERHRAELETELCEVRVELYRRMVCKHYDEQRRLDEARRPTDSPTKP